MADGAADELEILFPTSRRSSPIRTAAPISVAVREFRSRGAARLIVEALAVIAPDALDGETPRPAARGNGRMRRGRAGVAGGGQPAGIRSGSDGFPLLPPPFPWRCGRRTALFVSLGWRRSRGGRTTAGCSARSRPPRARPRRVRHRTRRPRRAPDLAADRPVLEDVYRNRRIRPPMTPMASPPATAHTPAANEIAHHAAMNISFNMGAA